MGSCEVMTYKEYLQVLKEHSPYDFSEYSDNSIFRRIQKVMRDYHLTMEELGARTQKDKFFVEQVVEAITVNTTELFRDPALWRFLFEKHFPAFRNNGFINIWHAGCSTGQEVYSLMILLNELGILDKAHIYASDISQKAIDIASKGAYKHQLDRGCIENFNYVFENQPGESVQFSNYFDVNEAGDKITIKPILQGKIKFLRHDLVNNNLPFYNKMDIIFCRNVLIYFNVKLQNRIAQRFYDNLYNQGTLILGAHEGLSGFFKTKFNRNGPVFTKSNMFHFKE